MFYCKVCQKKKGWPQSIFKSYGKCEICGDLVYCFDVPSSQLPKPVESKTIDAITGKEI